MKAASSFEEVEESDKKMKVDLSNEKIEEVDNYMVETPSEETDDEEGLTTEIVAKTPNGKEIQLVKHPVFTGFYIKFRGGGELPNELSGRWTTHQKAMEAVRVYLGKKLTSE